MLPYRVCVQKLCVKNATALLGVAAEPMSNKFWGMFPKIKDANAMPTPNRKNSISHGGLAKIQAENRPDKNSGHRKYLYIKDQFPARISNKMLFCIRASCRHTYHNQGLL